ncbi:hypothetical protein BC939DRAFT_469125 [Gamsiella multidivaricata]|uniref:uncharacterized protein n=1 Tax=Gamsiella multidivaricata TaxID=101098 RepID=UPI00221E9A1A|nr:uncharacterized protein BC939DRAFT_469125 [Gamsiella multidivaricata]KAI7816467.1 hypothetical protein BC939DRAFT_469125 [Gamsiella multidivaricata]
MVAQTRQQAVKAARTAEQAKVTAAAGLSFDGSGPKGKSKMKQINRNADEGNAEISLARRTIARDEHGLLVSTPPPSPVVSSSDRAVNDGAEDMEVTMDEAEHTQSVEATENKGPGEDAANGEGSTEAIAGDHPEESVRFDDIVEDIDEDDPGSFQVIRRTREKFNRVLVPLSSLRGETTEEKREDLMGMLKAAEVSVLARIKTKKFDGEHLYSVSVETEAQVQELLKMRTENADGARAFIFRRANDDWSQDRRRRTVEVCGLPPRITDTLVRLSLQKYGEIEDISRHICSRGIKVTLAVRFTSQAGIEKLVEEGTASLFVSNEHARLGRLGAVSLQWNTRHVCKLAGLPSQTSCNRFMLG